MIPQLIRRWGPYGDQTLPPVLRGGRGRSQSAGTGLPAVPHAKIITGGNRSPAREGVGPSRVDLMILPQEEMDVMVEEEEANNTSGNRDADDAGVDSNSLDSLSSSSSAYMRHHRYEDPHTAYQLISDPYDRHREIERQQRFISDSKRLGRPFIPSGGRALEKPTRYLLGDCVAALYRTVARDWPETDPMVISTAEDLVVVYMKRNRVRSTGTVLRYMNASLKRSEAVRTFGLQKVPEGWDVLTDDGHIMYTFKPPWVRQRRFLPDHFVAPPMNPDARPFIPTFARSQNQRQVYSRAALKEIELSVVENIRSASLAKIKLIPPAPVNFVSLVKLPSALEFLNVDHVVTLVRSGECSTNAKTPLWSSRVQPNTLSSSTRSVLPHPNQCQDGLEGCPIIQEVISSAVRKAASSRLGALLLQSGDVVLGLLQLALVFEARQSSLRLRLLAEQHPNVVNRIKEYLCGEGYHLPLPSVISHEDWQTLNSILKFDWIRDNRTRIFTEISKRWKKRHTQFEQFVHFFEYRDDRPLHPVKNMLTHSTTPVLVSVLSGDVMAVVLLARLGFFVPPDYYWDIFSFFAESLLPKSSDGEMYNLMRHLCLHLAERQQALRGDVFNPILPPQKK